MKTTKSLFGVLTITAGLMAVLQPCFGQAWVGTDCLCSNISTVNWTIEQYAHGQMSVVGTNGHASFLVPISSVDEQSVNMIWNGTPAVSNDWTMDVSGHNTASWSQNGGSALQLWLLNSTNTDTAYRIAMEGGHDQSDGYEFNTKADSANNAPVSPRQSVLATNANFGLRLVHRGGVAGDVEACYDSTGSGVDWTLLDTMSMADLWPGAVASNTFMVALVSDTYYGPVAEGQLWAENFLITNSAIGSPLPQVSLVQVSLANAVQPTFANLILSTNYQLQITTNLSGTFTNFGSALTATNNTMIYPQYFKVANWNQLFFRLQVAP